MNDIWLSKALIDSYSPPEQVALIQLMRFINSLRSWMTNLAALERAKNVYTCDALEIYYVICANYYEVCKSFFRDVYPALLNKYENNELKEEILKWENEWNSYRNSKSNKIYKIIDLLRNSVAFHYKDDFIKNNHTVKLEIEYIGIGFTQDGKTSTTRFVLSMNYALSEMKSILGNEFAPDSYLEYLNKHVLENVIHKNCHSLECLILELIGDYMYLTSCCINV